MKLINPISQILMVGAVVGEGRAVSWILLAAGILLELGITIVLAVDVDE